MYNYYDNQDFGNYGYDCKEEERCGFGAYSYDGYDGFDGFDGKDGKGKGGWDPKPCGKEEKFFGRKTCFCCQEIECPKPKPKPCPPPCPKPCPPKCDCCALLAAAFCRCCGGKRW